jgi:membrane-bound serine protease (ClpP class)
MKYASVFLTFLCAICFGSISSQNIYPVIYKIDIHKEIGPTSRLYLSNGLAEAKRHNAQAIIIDLNTYGGTLQDADSMRSAILYSPIPIYAYINNNAASAGALIAIACKKIYMVKGAGIGAATVVNEMGDAALDKYQSYMRGIIRTTAESHGKDTIISGKDTIYKWIRDPRIAEAMVDQTIAVPNVSDSGKVITFTSGEALKYGYCDGIVNSLEDLIEQELHYTNYQLISYEPSLFDNIKGFFQNPILQGFFIMIIIAGIYFEMQSPGIGFPSLAAGLAALLYFVPLYIDGLAENWEIILFIIGLILVALEIFVIPGFGITGIAGIIFSMLGLTLALLNNHAFDFGQVEIPDVSRSLLTVMSGIIMAFVLMLYLSSRIGEAGIFKKIALNTQIESAIVTPEEKNSLIGKTGRAATVLRPSGKVMIDNEVYDAIAETFFIDEGACVTVVRQEAAQIYVSPDPV